MNTEWSEMHKSMQTLIKKEATFQEGMRILFDMRDEMMASKVLSICLMA